MSRWHREHPELVGTDADPWMDDPRYAESMREHEERERVANLRARWGSKRLWFVHDADDEERGYFTEYDEDDERESAQWTLTSVGVEGEPRVEAKFGNDLRAAIKALEEHP